MGKVGTHARPLLKKLKEPAAARPAVRGSNGLRGWDGPRPCDPSPPPAATAEVQVRRRRPRAPDCEAARAGSRGGPRGHPGAGSLGHAPCYHVGEKFPTPPVGPPGAPGRSRGPRLGTRSLFRRLKSQPVPRNAPPLEGPFSDFPPRVVTRVSRGKHPAGLREQEVREPQDGRGQGHRSKCPADGASGARAGNGVPHVSLARRRAAPPCSTASRVNSARQSPTHAGGPPGLSRRPAAPSAQARPPQRACPGLASARPAPSLVLSTHSTTGEGAGEEGAQPPPT